MHGTNLGWEFCCPLPHRGSRLIKKDFQVVCHALSDVCRVSGLLITITYSKEERRIANCWIAMLVWYCKWHTSAAALFAY
jgi:hypothetical protein